MFRTTVERLVEKQDLTRQDAYTAMTEIMEGTVAPTLIAAFLVALRMKGETIDEATGFAEAMREKMTPITPKADNLVDTCGTGGDQYKTFNISTAAAFVAAAAGAFIAKHGNRAVSSKCGSADVLEALEIKLNLSPQQVADCIDEVGIGFMFAPACHPAMKFAAPVRKELGLRTVFNLLGPLANPARARTQVLGVFSPEHTQFHAQILQNLGSHRAFVVHGLDGLDEITVTGPTQISELCDGIVKTIIIEPENYELKRAKIEELACGTDVKENAEILTNVLNGELSARRDVVLINASAALVAAGLAQNLMEGIEKAKEAIDSGSAVQKLKALHNFTTKVAKDAKS